MLPEPARRLALALRRTGNDLVLRRQSSKVDAFLTSYPKSGRTWLRFLLSSYFARVADLNFEPDLRTTFRVLPNFDRDHSRGLPAFEGRRRGVSLPLIAVSHRAYDRGLFSDRPIVMLVRDPRDVCVSAYFHETRHKHRFSGDILTFIEDEKFGVPAIVEYHNGWAKGLPGHAQSLVVSYEAMHRDTVSTIVEILRFLDTPVDHEALAHAIERAKFDRMRKDEQQAGIPGHDYNRNDADSLRVRKGEVGGFSQYLSDAEAARIIEICSQRLNDGARNLMARSGIDL
jgi:Sulfotransferase domain